jgi:hypothetical protein
MFNQQDPGRSERRTRRRLARTGVAIAAMATLGAITADTASADSSTGKYYSIANQQLSTRVLSVSSSSSGSAVTLQPYSGSHQQHWHWEPSVGAGMHLVNVDTGLCLNAEFPGGPLTQRTCNTSSNQEFLWTHVPQQRLRHVPSGHVLNGNLDQVRLAPPSGFDNPNQVFKQTFRGTL